MNAILDLIRKLYHPRSCRFPITPQDICLKKHQVCLEYHIKNCGAPCVGRQTAEDYRHNIEQAREILKGNTRDVLRSIKTEMIALAEQLRFEEAEELKHRYMLIDQFVAKSEVVSHTIDNVDVLTVTNEGNTAFVNYIHVANGAVNQSFTFEYKKRLDERDEELLQLAVVEMRNRFQSNAREVILLGKLTFRWRVSPSPCHSAATKRRY